MTWLISLLACKDDPTGGVGTDPTDATDVPGPTTPPPPPCSLNGFEPTSREYALPTQYAAETFDSYGNFVCFDDRELL